MSGAGKRRFRLQFSKRMPKSDGYGNTEAGEWTPQFEQWTAIRFLRGTETVQAARLEGRSPAILTIRNSVNARQITHEWRAEDLQSGEIYQIKENPRLTDDRADLEMLAEAGVAA